MLVRDWMSKPAICISPEATLADARSLMERKGIRRLAVLERNRITGILTRSDIDSAEGRRDQTRVRDTMTSNPTTIGPDETLEDAAMKMLRGKISGLPVVSESRVLGMITETDVFRALTQVLGFHERGARVVIDVDSPDALVHWLGKFAQRTHVRTVVTYRDPVSGGWKALVRLRGRKVPAPGTLQQG